MKTALFLLGVLVLTTALFGATIYVPDDYATIQDAIDASVGGDTIIVRSGTYGEDISMYGKDIALVSEQGPNTTTIEGRGSYYGNPTVTVSNTTGSNLKIEGFTITNGFRGGIKCSSSSVTIRNNIIRENYARYSGGGISYSGSVAPTIVDNIITSNSAQTGGGGIYCSGSSAAIIQDNTISDNVTVDGQGGGIYCESNAEPLIVGNTISGNSTMHGGSGGGIACRNSSPTITSNRISGNIGSAGSNGGGIYIYYAPATVDITNNLIEGNSGSSRGGGIHCADSPAALVNNTITGNSSFEGGGIYCSDSTLTVANTILWDNSGTNGPEICVGTSYNPSTLTISYSDVKGGLASVFVDTGCTLNWGAAMIDADPLFLSGPDGPFYLSQLSAGQATDSPCLDAGDPLCAMITGTTRTDRVQDDGVVDMGYHYPKLDITIYVPDDYYSIQTAIEHAANGDTVIVRPGIYQENIDFLGKAITVESEQGAAVTTIDAPTGVRPVTFANYETSESILDGFTLTGGLTSPGGGIYCGGSCAPTITNNTIVDNTANIAWFGGIGGGIYCDSYSSPIIINNTISENTAHGDGGGIYCSNGCTAIIANNTISENDAHESGGAICVHGGNTTLTITNHTISRNSASDFGDGIYCDGSTATVSNTILWDNGASGQEIYVSSGNVSVTYCDVKGGWPGTGNIDADPLFVEPTNGDYHITLPSPCRDAGDNTLVAETEDFEGDPRIADDVVDMGADEFHAHLYYVGNLIPGSSGEARITGLAPNQLLLATSGLRDPPLNLSFGELWLTLPLWAEWQLGTMPSTGVYILPVTIPTAWVPGEPHYFQVLIGKIGYPKTRATNLLTLTAE